MRRPNSPAPRNSQDTRRSSPPPDLTLRRSNSDVSHPRKKLLAKLKHAGSTSSSSTTPANSSGGSTLVMKQFIPSHSRTGSNPALTPLGAPSPTATPTVASKPNSSPSKNARDMHGTMHRLGSIPAQVSLAPAMSAAASASSLSLTSTATITNNAPSSVTSTTDPWHMLHVRVLPLFNGEPLRMPIESLNQLVQDHISRLVSRSPSRAIGTLEQDLVAFLAAGMLTINVKLSELDDETVLSRVVEIWEFFWHQVLPYVEGVFLPLQTDTLIRTLSRTPKTPHRSSSPARPDEVPLTASIQSIDVRTLALRSFRDNIILPIYPRLHTLFSAPKKEKDAKHQERTYNKPRMQQMLLVLVSAAQRANSLADPPPPSQGESAVVHLLRDIRNPQGLGSAPPLGVGRLPTFFSGSAPRDRRGRIARKSARYTALNLKTSAALRDGDDWQDDETPRNTGFGDEREKEFAILQSLQAIQSPEDPDEPPNVDGGAGGWGLGKGQEHRGVEEEEDDEPLDWDQAQNVVERMIGLRG